MERGGAATVCWHFQPSIPTHMSFVSVYQHSKAPLFCFTAEFLSCLDRAVTTVIWSVSPLCQTVPPEVCRHLADSNLTWLIRIWMLTHTVIILFHCGSVPYHLVVDNRSSSFNETREHSKDVLRSQSYILPGKTVVPFISEDPGGCLTVNCLVMLPRCIEAFRSEAIPDHRTHARRFTLFCGLFVRV